MAQGIKIKKEWIEAISDWLELQSVRDNQIILGFTNFYKKFIQNFNRIAVSLTLMLQTTDAEALNTQATKNKKNQEVSSSTAGAG